MRQQVIFFLMISAFGFAVSDICAQNPQPKTSRQSSLDAFTKGNYEVAYIGFSELLLTYSKDPLYKYYSGVCLVKLKKNSDEAVSMLQQALQGSSVVRTVPSDVLFYLGRAQQMSGRFNDALESYNLFAEQSGKKAARELGVQDYVQQCNDKKGQITKQEIGPDEIIKKGKTETITTGNNTLEGEILKRSSGEEKVNKEVVPENYDMILTKALNYQVKADSLNAIADERKKELDKLSYAEKTALRSRISEIEKSAVSYQKLADQKYSEAQAMIRPRQELIVSAGQGNRIKSDSVITKTERVTSVITDTKGGITKDTIVQVQEKTPPKEAVLKVYNQVRKDSVSQSVVKQNTLPVIKKPVEVYSLFEVVAKPVYAATEKVPINPSVPAGLIYRIQIAVFRNPVAPSYFRGITPMYGFKAEESDKTNYYAGMFRRSADANKALTTVKAKGFRDAFVVAFSGNKPVSADRAVILEKEWGKKALIKVKEASRDTVAPTLAFRVEVARSVKPLKNDIIDNMKKMAGNRGFDILTLPDGKIVYLIGKFITFESASEYGDLLIRNGYRESRVVAWLGKKEIPVETARQLFERLE